MQIQLWGEAILRCATTALRSMSCHTADAENALWEVKDRVLGGLFE